jgi:flagellar protein FliS
MHYTKISQSYKSASTETATPGKLILMLYDGALNFLRLAKAGFEEKTNSKRNEHINSNLLKALSIILELRGCLNMTLPGDFSMTMYRLYVYMEEKLVEANLHKKVEPIKEVEKHLIEIRSAWAEMLKKSEDGSTSIPASGVSCSA